MLVDDSLEIRSQAKPTCCLCGSEGKELYAGLTDRLFGAPGYWNLKQCHNSSCGLVWLDPMPLAEDIGVAYKGYFTHQVSENARNKNFKHIVMDWLRKMLAAISGINGMQQARKHQYLENKQVGKLLEVGCGAGDYLNLMRNRGWDVEGVDFDTEAAKNASEQFDIKVHSGQLKDINYPDGNFDAITMSHVIEHIFDPVSLLQECRRILKPTGCLVIITPNVKSYGHSYFNSGWRALEPPRHVFLYSSLSLKRLADKAGFNDVDVFTTPVSAEGVFRGSLSIRKVGRYDMQEKSSFLSPFEKLQAALMQVMEASRIKDDPELGEEVVMICRSGSEP